MFQEQLVQSFREVMSLDISADSSRLLVVSADGLIQVLSALSSATTQSWRIENAEFTKAVFAREELVVAVGNEVSV